MTFFCLLLNSLYPEGTLVVVAVLKCNNFDNQTIASVTFEEATLER